MHRRDASDLFDFGRDHVRRNLLHGAELCPRKAERHPLDYVCPDRALCVEIRFDVTNRFFWKKAAIAGGLFLVRRALKNHITLLYSHSHKEGF